MENAHGIFLNYCFSSAKKTRFFLDLNHENSVCFLEVNPMGMWETHKIGYPRVFNSQVSSHSGSSDLSELLCECSEQFMTFSGVCSRLANLSCVLLYLPLYRFQASSLPCDLSSLRSLRITDFQFVHYYLVENGNDNL